MMRLGDVWGEMLVAKSSAATVVVHPRIGGVVASNVLGVGLVLGGLFALLASAGGSPGANEIGIIAISIGISFLAGGVVLGIARKIERRLIDIQLLIVETAKAGDGSQTNEARTRATGSATLSEGDEVRLYGIEFDGKQYVYGQYKYSKLNDALAYARKTHVAAPPWPLSG